MGDVIDSTLMHTNKGNAPTGVKSNDSILLIIYKVTLGNLRTTTTILSTTTGSKLQCTAQARPVNFVVVVSSTTPNKVESRRPAIHKLQLVKSTVLSDF